MKDEVVKSARIEDLFKKYKPYTLRLPNGSSITMDNRDAMIKLCKERGIEFDFSKHSETKTKDRDDAETNSDSAITETGTKKETVKTEKTSVRKNKESKTVRRKGFKTK